MVDAVRHIDINCDLGEGVGKDQQIMPLISSCNIACGGHFGNRKTVLETIELAIKNGVKIGAHPSFPDRDNFGRKDMDIPKDELYRSVCDQITLVQELCDLLGGQMHHIKLHGALYNRAARDIALGQLVYRVMETLGVARIYAPANSVFSDLVPEKLICEGFLDRRYADDGQLVSRTEPNSLIVEEEEVWKQARSMVMDGNIQTISGRLIPVQVDTLCVHGDTASALEILNRVRNGFNALNIQVK